MVVFYPVAQQPSSDIEDRLQAIQEILRRADQQTVGYNICYVLCVNDFAVSGATVQTCDGQTELLKDQTSVYVRLFLNALQRSVL